MDRSEYLSAVREFFYQGEVMGEAFSSRAVGLETDRCYCEPFLVV